MHVFPNLSYFILFATSDGSDNISNALWVHFLLYLNRVKHDRLVRYLYINDIPTVLFDCF
jgi:hypothetical protein